LTQAHLDLRAAREQRRDDVTDADGDTRTTCEDGHERTRVMIYGPVTTSRIAYRKRGKENLCPQDAELNWGQQSYSAGVIRRNAEAVAVSPFGQAAGQVSAQGAIRLGKRQAGELAVAAAADFEAFYAWRRPQPCEPGTGLLLTADGSAFPVLPGALRPATAKAAAARARAAGSSGWPDDPGELRKSRKRMAELAAVADIPPAPRTAGDILAAFFGPAGRSSGGPAPAAGPKAAGKTLFASARRPAGEVIAEAFAEAHRRDPGRKREWAVLIDGTTPRSRP
ncbi:MAG: ISKra4 family transposase, partial [Streptosporangiaceae bacterium]